MQNAITDRYIQPPPFISGELFVPGAVGLAHWARVSQGVIGATVAAFALRTILGSNIFNGLFIVAIAAMIYPISVSWREVAVALVLGFVAVALTFPTRAGFIERRRGVLLLVLYTVYLATMLQR